MTVPEQPNIYDPTTGNSASLSINVKSNDAKSSLFSVRLAAGTRAIENFSLQLRKDDKNGILPSAIITSNGTLLVEAPDSALEQVRRHYDSVWKSQMFLAKDGSSIVDKIKPLLQVPEYQGIPLGEGLSIADFKSRQTRARELEASILQESPEVIVAGSRMLMLPDSGVENQRLFVLAARTGIAPALAVCNELVNTLDAGRRGIAANELIDRADPKCTDALIVLMASSNFNTRRMVHQALHNIVTAQGPAFGATIGQSAIRFLEQPGLWFQERSGDNEVDDVILLLYGYPTPLASLTLAKHFAQMTTNERSAVMYAALSLRDELSLSMVRRVLADKNANGSGLRSACRAAGELGDLECIPSLFPLIDHNDARIANAAQEALQKISFENLSQSSGVWADWWDSFLEKCQDVKAVMTTAENKLAAEKERITAIRVISALRPPGSLSVLARCAQETSPAIQLPAIRGLARQCGAESLQLFTALLKNSNADVTREAFEALKFRTQADLPGTFDAWQKWLNDIMFDGAKLEELLKRTATVASFSLPPRKPRFTAGQPTESGFGGADAGTSGAVNATGVSAGAVEAREAQDEATASVAGWVVAGLIAFGVGLFGFWMYRQSQLAAQEREQAKKRKAGMRADMGSIEAINRQLDQRQR